MPTCALANEGTSAVPPAPTKRAIAAPIARLFVGADDVAREALELRHRADVPVVTSRW